MTKEKIVKAKPFLPLSVFKAILESAGDISEELSNFEFNTEWGDIYADIEMNLPAGDIITDVETNEILSVTNINGIDYNNYISKFIEDLDLDLDDVIYNTYFEEILIEAGDWLCGALFNRLKISTCGHDLDSLDYTEVLSVLESAMYELDTSPGSINTCWIERYNLGIQENTIQEKEICFSEKENIDVVAETISINGVTYKRCSD